MIYSRDRTQIVATTAKHLMSGRIEYVTRNEVNERKFQCLVPSSSISAEEGKNHTHHLQPPNMKGAAGYSGNACPIQHTTTNQKICHTLIAAALITALSFTIWNSDNL